MDLQAIDVSPINFKDHRGPELNVPNERLGVTEAVNIVITPVMWPLSPTYIALHGFDVTKDYQIYPPSKSVNGK